MRAKLCKELFFVLRELSVKLQNIGRMDAVVFGVMHLKVRKKRFFFRNIFLKVRLDKKAVLHVVVQGAALGGVDRVCEYEIRLHFVEEGSSHFRVLDAMACAGCTEDDVHAERDSGQIAIEIDCFRWKRRQSCWNTIEIDCFCREKRQPGRNAIEIDCSCREGKQSEWIAIETS